MRNTGERAQDGLSVLAVIRRTNRYECPQHPDASSHYEGGRWLCFECQSPTVAVDYVTVREADYRGAVEALEAADRLAEGVLRWVSHVQLEQLTGEYQAARHRAGGQS